MTEELKKQINEAYQTGTSILHLALIHRLEVAEVYDIIGLSEMNSVRFTGDQIDGNIPGVEISHGQTYNVPYTKN